MERLATGCAAAVRNRNQTFIADPISNPMKTQVRSHQLTRRQFLRATAGTALAAPCLIRAAAVGGALSANPVVEPEGLAPIGRAKGTHPGRVVWVHDPQATDWKGPGNGHWWEPEHTRQDEVDQMMSRAICGLAGEPTAAPAWEKLFQHSKQARGQGEIGYKPGEKVAIKVNFVGMIWRGGGVNPESYKLEKQRDYMNTSPQVMLALLRQLTGVVGVRQQDILLGDTLALFAQEYYDLLSAEFPKVNYVDHAGKLGRVEATLSTVPFYWSARPQGCRQDYVAKFLADADHIVNLANLKAHTGAGVTLCAKNHFGSLVRRPPEPGYYDLHPSGFSKDEKSCRVLVDLMGHSQIGGKTVLCLIDGLYPGIHPKEQAPKPWKSAPFDGHWAASLLASQDPVAIDSVGFDLLWTEYEDFPRRGSVDDYLHEAALANDPPSGTFYDPDHQTNVTRLASLGVHEHWNNAREKKYSRNLGTGQGIELVQVGLGRSKRELSASTATIRRG